MNTTLSAPNGLSRLLTYVLICAAWTIVSLPTSLQGQPTKLSFADLSQMKVVSLINGPNFIDLNGDRTEDLVFLGRFENYNAHSSTNFSFYINASIWPNESTRWYVVPFEKAQDERSDQITTHEGADCIPRDLRVLRQETFSGSSTIVVVGDCELGKSHAEAGPVCFTFYRLARNEEGFPGWPPFYFAEEKTIRGKQKHADINEASLSELGIGQYK